VRNLNQDARTVARLRIASARTAVRQIDQDLNTLVNDVVGFLSFYMRNKADAAAIVLMPRIVKAPR
jgi:hypothetical protein